MTVTAWEPLPNALEIVAVKVFEPSPSVCAAEKFRAESVASTPFTAISSGAVPVKLPVTLSCELGALLPLAGNPIETVGATPYSSAPMS